jgi:hypothetical protein
MKDKPNKKYKLAVVLFFTLPFGISAAAEFLPTWVSAPAILLMAMFWLSSFIMIGKEASND